MRTFHAFLILLLLPLPSPSAMTQRDPTHYVDPFIGTAGHGHTFPGATMPFGMVQLSPDTRLTGWDGCSGYHPHNWTIRLISQYSSQYPGGGDLALIDGTRGTTNWSGGAWQGYQGQDFVAVVDLGKTETIREVGAGFLQDIGSWIWMPRQVDFEISADGQSFAPVVTIPTDVTENNYQVVIKEFGKAITPQKARYIRIRAHNYGKIPTWHAGSGGDSWIFVDEIIIN